MTKTNRSEVESRWIHVLRREKVEELLEYAETLYRHFQEESDRKNSLLRTLHDVRFDAAEDQFQILFSSHVRNLDDLINLHDERLRNLERDFTRNLAASTAEAARERRAAEERHATELADHREALARSRDAAATTEAEEERAFQRAVHETKNRTLEDVNGLRVVLESRTEDLDEQFVAARADHVAATEKIATDHRELSERDAVVRGEAEERTRRTRRVSRRLRRARCRRERNHEETDSRYRSLAARKAAALNDYRTLKDQMNRFRDARRQRLTELSVEADRRKRILRGHQETAERVMRYARLNAAMEKERERDFSYVRTEENDRDVEERTRRMVESNRMQFSTTRTEPSNNDPEFADYMDRFWKKYNEVLLDLLYVQKKEAELKDERQQLEIKLKAYKDGVSVNSDVMNSNNPLLVVNGRVRPPKKSVSPKSRRLTVVDANHIITTSRVRNGIQ